MVNCVKNLVEIKFSVFCVTVSIICFGIQKFVRVCHFGLSLRSPQFKLQYTQIDIHYSNQTPSQTSELDLRINCMIISLKKFQNYCHSKSGLLHLKLQVYDKCRQVHYLSWFVIKNHSFPGLQFCPLFELIIKTSKLKNVASLVPHIGSINCLCWYLCCKRNWNCWKLLWT